MNIGGQIHTLKVHPRLLPGATATTASFVIQTRPATSLGKLFGLVLQLPVRDRAGNLLDGAFRGAFPTGGSQPGTSFQVLVQTNGTKIVSVQPWSGDTSLIQPSHKKKR